MVAVPVDAATARGVGERLAAHVRFEERVLFELLEARLPPQELAALGAAVEAADERGPLAPVRRRRTSSTLPSAAAMVCS